MEETNILLLTRLSKYLNNHPDYINKHMVQELIKLNLDEEEAMRLLLETILFEDSKEIQELYLPLLIKKLDIRKYQNNQYYKNIKLDNIKEKNWSLKNLSYKPYELFVYDDLKILEDKRVIPQIGFFNQEYKYPCVLQNNREWMLITPNEIETMEKPIEEAFGNVLTYGLGLGYFPYMISLKDEVLSITIVEIEEDVITLFEKYILPQFPNKDKIKIIKKDAYVYEKTHQEKYDYVFVDIWHDPSDGVEAYLKFKKLERKNTRYSYWIENTIKYYL